MTVVGQAVHSKANGLLAALVPFSVLVQPEVALTRSICWLLGLEGGSRALDGLIRAAGIEPGDGGPWLTEVVSEDGGRADLEYRSGDGLKPLVVVEAKIGHTLTVDQIAGYRARLPDDGGLLALLVPEGRRHEGEQVLRDLRASEPDERVRLAVWSYEQVTVALEAALPGSPDVAQFRGLVEASRALDVAPLSPSDLLDNSPARRDDIWRVLDEASFGMFGRSLPAGTDWSLERRRYVELVPYTVGMAVGIGRKSREHEGQAQTWAWLRLPDSAPFHWVAQSVAEQSRPGETSRDKEGLWVPLHVPTGVPGSVMIQTLRGEIEALGSAIREAVGRAVAELDAVAPEFEYQARPLLGMPAMDAADLLDNSDARLEDIKLVLRQAARIFSHPRYPLLPDEEYVATRWVPVKGYDTHISTCIGRKDRPDADSPQPWAWLRIHEATPDAKIAFAALEGLAPGRVVVDRHGRAIPIEIPPGESGPRMLEAVRDQMHQVMVAIRAALAAHYRSGEQA